MARKSKTLAPRKEQAGDVKILNRGARTFNTAEGIIGPGKTSFLSKKYAAQMAESYPKEIQIL